MLPALTSSSLIKTLLLLFRLTHLLLLRFLRSQCSPTDWPDDLSLNMVILPQVLSRRLFLNKFRYLVNGSHLRRGWWFLNAALMWVRVLLMPWRVLVDVIGVIWIMRALILMKPQKGMSSCRRSHLLTEVCCRGWAQRRLILWFSI
jgi:hypothetical protein